MRHTAFISILALCMSDTGGLVCQNETQRKWLYEKQCVCASTSSVHAATEPLISEKPIKSTLFMNCTITGQLSSLLNKEPNFRN